MSSFQFQLYVIFIIYRSGSESQQTPNPQVQRRPSYQTQRSEGRISVSGSKMKRLDTFGNVKRRRTTPPNWTGLQMGDGYGNDQVSSSLHWIIEVLFWVFFVQWINFLWFIFNRMLDPYQRRAVILREVLKR